jgi:hypothetical protein
MDMNINVEDLDNILLTFWNIFLKCGKDENVVEIAACNIVMVNMT